MNPITANAKKIKELAYKILAPPSQNLKISQECRITGDSTAPITMNASIMSFIAPQCSFILKAADEIIEYEPPKDTVKDLVNDLCSVAYDNRISMHDLIKMVRNEYSNEAMRMNHNSVVNAARSINVDRGHFARRLKN